LVLLIILTSMNSTEPFEILNLVIGIYLLFGAWHL